MPNGIDLKGWDEFRSILHTLPGEIIEESTEEVNDGARYWEELAKRAAPQGSGIVTRISSANKGVLHAEVYSPVEYSPYVEWGTGSRAIVPAELASYAAQWWTKKKHIGRYPHPYFFIQAPIVDKFVFDNIRKILATAH